MDYYFTRVNLDLAEFEKMQSIEIRHFLLWNKLIQIPKALSLDG